MDYLKVLERIEKEELTPELAYKELYKEEKPPKPGKRATFIKINIHVPEEDWKVNTFLRILFAIPIPMMFARMGLRFASRFAKLDSEDVNIDEVLKLLKYSKNTRIDIDTDEAKVDIKIM